MESNNSLWSQFAQITRQEWGKITALFRTQQAIKESGLKMGGGSGRNIWNGGETPQKFIWAVINC